MSVLESFHSVWFAPFLEKFVLGVSNNYLDAEAGKALAFALEGNAVLTKLE